MSRTAKSLVALGILASLCLLVFFLLAPTTHNATATPSSASDGSIPESTTTQAAHEVAITPEDYSQVLEPYELSKNPYKWQGQAGLLDTVHVAMPMPNGETARIPYPGGGLRFEKMIDAHIATYSVLVGGMDVAADGEIAVLLADSDPPNPRRPWKVFVEGPIQGTTALGGDVQVTALSFRGYYEPPKSEVTTIIPPANTNATSKPTTALPAASEPDMKSPENSTPPQDLERV